ncbi:arylsulfatase [Bradyrhizobium sp. 41S5]|uniref:arylsulfatase n=1 Tax=Bradyrhizobium sp. 41S5 TaxID=1404443 RepID=UPI00156AF381|nr:arylsulfatase [Bradyrhizobium sp. 41S5]UFX43933.1 arylsulfatase [Bradyrhizobium sp. 41S5]
MSNDEFKGKIGRTIPESTPWWPDYPRPRDGAPNVLVVLFDDLGFSHLGCYGSSIETPNIDKLAAGGLRFTNFHTTALCSPTRAALLTGRNHHSVGMRGLANWNTGFPNCTGTVAKSAGTLAEMLRPGGYSTFAVGKWHLTPMEETSVAGPFDQWPLSRGFDRYYGFLQGETDQFAPELYCDNHPVNAPSTPEQGYHLSEDLVDQAITMVRSQKSAVPEKPFFLYLAFGATHAPHQAPQPYVDKYKGRFDAGWDTIRQHWYERQKQLGIIPPDTELAPRNPGVEPWNKLPDTQKKLALKLQEAFAAFLDHTDAQIGRMVSFLEDIGELDNTLILLMSDNGASQEGGPLGVIDTFKYFNGIPETLEEINARMGDIGGPKSQTNYPWGWAQAGNTPNKRYKQNTHGGGIRDPLIAHWPKGIADKGGIRHQFHHVTDITPTVLDIVGVTPPESVNGVAQMPIHGVSLAYTFPEQAKAEPSRKGVQYFEMFGHRGIWADGWKAVTFHPGGNPFDQDQWELYNLENDFSECRDLAKENPAKLEEMINLWWSEAGRYGALPLDDRRDALWRPTPRQRTPRNRRRFVLYPPVQHMTGEVSPPLGNRSFVATAEVERPTATSEGAIFALGTRNNGMAFYVLGDRLVFDYNLFTHHCKAISDRPIPAGKSTLSLHLEKLGESGRATVSIDGVACGSVEIPKILRMISSNGMDAGCDGGSAVSDDYQAPFYFQGKIKRLVIEMPDRRKKDEAEAMAVKAKIEMARQ